ncbi:MAG: 50S ribosomal protein L3 [Candidatus Pacebacteria bacterium]|nr:50S ribosomal protein L3 [Candidatus Paceibacterota bacterium]
MFGGSRAVAISAFTFSMKFILARKDRMTQIWGEDGVVAVGTVLKTSPLVVTQVKTPESKDGYSAVQVGFEEQKPSRISKSVLGHTKGRGFKVIKEFRVDDSSTYALGGEIGIDTFTVGDDIEVVGTTKGKGFAGVVKRHGFHGGRRSHGQKHSEREAGSIGGGGRAGGRVAKGLRMAGRMGGDRVTVKGLKVLHVDASRGEIIVSGAVPGARGGLIEVVATK